MANKKFQDSKKRQPSAGKLFVSRRPSDNNDLPGAFSLFWLSKDAAMFNFSTLLYLWLMPTLALSGLLSIVDYYTSDGRKLSYSNFYHDNHTGMILLILFSLLLALAIFYFTPAITYTQIQGSRAQKLNLNQAITATKPLVTKYFLSTLLVGLMVTGGLILFIVPGIIWLKKYFFTQYFVIDKNQSIRQAMRASARITAGQYYSIFGVIFVSALFSLTSLVPITGRIISFILGFLYSCAFAIRYDQLRKISKS